MKITDPISDLFTRIRNAFKARKEEVLVPASKMKRELLRILKEEGYLKGYQYQEDQKQGILKIQLKYFGRHQPALKGIKRVSKPSSRVYVKSSEIPYVMGGFGTAIISTSKGLMTDREARSLKLGGEVVCSIW